MKIIWNSPKLFVRGGYFFFFFETFVFKFAWFVLPTQNKQLSAIYSDVKREKQQVYTFKKFELIIKISCSVPNNDKQMFFLTMKHPESINMCKLRIYTFPKERN